MTGSGIGPYDILAVGSYLESQASLPELTPTRPSCNLLPFQSKAYPKRPCYGDSVPWACFCTWHIMSIEGSRLGANIKGP